MSEPQLLLPRPRLAGGSPWGRGQQVVGEGRWEAGGGHCPLADSLLVSLGSALSLHGLLRPRVPGRAAFPRPLLFSTSCPDSPSLSLP